MPSRKPAPSKEEEKAAKEAAEALRLAQTARENPFYHFTHREARILFGFGEKFFRALMTMEDAPSAANKINPEHFRQFLWDNRAVIATLSQGGEQDAD